MIRIRLTRINGQLGGINRMVENDRYCMDILVQTRAVIAALRGVEDLIMENHLNTCVTDALSSNDLEAKDQTIGEIMEIFGKYRKHG